MEHIPGEPMDKFIFKNHNLNENLIQLFTKQIVSAIAYMHSKFVMHRFKDHIKLWHFLILFLKGYKKL